MVEYAKKAFEPVQKVIADMSGGVNYGVPASKINDNQFSDVLNLQFLIGLLRKDTGYVALNQKPRGTPQRTYQFFHTNGIVEQLLITTATVYRNIQSQWQLVGDGTNANTTLTANTAAGGNVFNVAAEHFSVNDYVGIILNDGSQLQGQVTAVNPGGLTITLNANVPAGKTALNGAPVMRAPALNGSADFFVVALTWAPQNWVIFTNGVDNVQYYDGTNVQALAGWSGTVQSCRSLLAYNGFLMAFDTTEGGSRLPQRNRWTDQGNPNALSGGLSGFVDFIDTEDFILTAAVLGPWVIIYRQNSIMRRTYVGDVLQLFYDEYMLRSTEVLSVGAISAGAVCATGASHVFASQSGVFRYQGGYDVEDIGQPIFDRFLGPLGTLNTAMQDRTFMLYVAELDEVWFFVPTGQNSYPDTLLRLSDESWWVRQFADQISMADKITSFQSQGTWASLTSSWPTLISPWVSRAAGAAAPLIALCDPVANQVWTYDYQSSTDGGTLQPFSLVTKDYEVIAEKVRFDGLYAKGTGNNILVEISYDRGQTYHTVGTLNFGMTFSQKNVCGQLAVDVFRLRLSGTDPLFQLDWIRVDYYQETPW